MKKLVKKPTFLIQMLDNQNMTWQGIITLLDTNQKMPFRSLLELLKLMDSAMNQLDSGQELEHGQDTNVLSFSQEED